MGSVRTGSWSVVVIAVAGLGGAVAAAACRSSAARGGDGARSGDAAVSRDGALSDAAPASDVRRVADAGRVGRPAKAIGVGEHTSCALLVGGEVRCWGALRLAATPQASVPTAVGIDDAVSLAVGPMHVCVARADGTVWCWGDNRDGQLGDGTDDARGVPTRVDDVSGIVEVVAGGHHTCARDGAGAVWCWGTPGTVGHARAAAAKRPGRVAGLAKATRLVAGDDVACAFVDGGKPRCWGFNTTGLVGAALGPVKRAVASPPLASAVAVAIGFRHVCLTQEDGVVFCAGADQFGQLGDQRAPDDASCDPYDRRGVVCRWTDRPPPTPVPSPGAPPMPYRPDLRPPPPASHEEVYAVRSGFVLAGGVRAVALGAGHGRSCAITPDAEVMCWGQWYSSQEWAFRRPRVIAGTRGAVAVAVAEEHACALVADGAVRCWGYNRAGELGNGTVAELMIAVTEASPVAFP